MKWFQPILPLLLALALPCEAADPLPPAEIAELRAPRAEALRRAQRELRQSEDHSSPYFWAAFTLTGQWR